jgi:hypothetical protein
MRAARRSEGHLSHRSNWLRAAVLGANDGIVSTSSLVLGPVPRRRIRNSRLPSSLLISLT